MESMVDNISLLFIYNKISALPIKKLILIDYYQISLTD